MSTTGHIDIPSDKKLYKTKDMGYKRTVYVFRPIKTVSSMNDGPAKVRNAKGVIQNHDSSDKDDGDTQFAMDL